MEQQLRMLDIAVSIVAPLLATVLALAFEANYLTSTVLYFGPLSLWLSLRTPKMVAKTALFTAIVSIPLALILGSVSVLDGGWFIPTTVFPVRLFGILAVEDIITLALLCYATVMFYEHFLDHGIHELVDRRMKYLVWPLGIVTIAVCATLAFQPQVLAIPYAYAWLGLFAGVLPMLTFLTAFPRLLSKYIKVGAYFFYVLLLYEFTGLQLQHWTFPGTHFIGWMELFGYRFPAEELFLWMELSAMGILTYFEFFDDDRR